MYPEGYLSYLKGYIGSQLKGKVCLHVGYVFYFLLFSKSCLLVNTFVIFLLNLFVRNFRGTCSSIEMLKGYMDRESLWTPVLTWPEPGQQWQTINESVCCFDSNMVHWFAWKQGKRNMSRTVKKEQQTISLLKLCKKQKFRLIGEQTAAARNDVTAKKIVGGLFQNLQP